MGVDVDILLGYASIKVTYPTLRANPPPVLSFMVLSYFSFLVFSLCVCRSCGTFRLISFFYVYILGILCLCFMLV